MENFEEPTPTVSTCGYSVMQSDSKSLNSNTRAGNENLEILDQLSPIQSGPLSTSNEKTKKTESKECSNAHYEGPQKSNSLQLQLSLCMLSPSSNWNNDLEEHISSTPTTSLTSLSSQFPNVITTPVPQQIPQTENDFFFENIISDRELVVCSVPSQNTLIANDIDNNEITLPPQRPRSSSPSPPPPTPPQQQKLRTSFNLLKMLTFRASLDMSSSEMELSKTEIQSHSNFFSNSKKYFNHFSPKSKQSQEEANVYNMEKPLKMVHHQVKNIYSPLKTKGSSSSSSSLLFTVHVNDNYVKFEDDISQGHQQLERKVLGDFAELEEIHEDLWNEYPPPALIDKRFELAFKLAKLYPRSKKEIVDTQIPLTGTSLFTRRKPFWTRFCQSLKTLSFCVCCSKKDASDEMTHQESIEAFHNEILGLGADERPEGIFVQRRKSVLCVTKSMRAVQRLHSTH